MAKKGTVIRFSICVVLVLCLCGTALAQVGIGKWRDHFNYRTTYRIIPAKERIYAQGALGLFYYDTEDYTINKLTKVEGLSDVGIATAAYDDKSDYLAIAYTNSNLDLVRDDRVYNLSDIKRSDISGDKNIYSIRFRKGKAYLCCGFGVAVVDLDRKEIADVYRLGTDGTPLKVNDIAFFDGKIIAALDSGLVMADENQRFLNIFTYWSHDSTSIIKDKPIKKIETLGDRLFALVSDSSQTEILTATTTTSFQPWLSGDIRSLRVGDNTIIVSTFDTVHIYDASLTLLKEYAPSSWFALEATDAITHSSHLWATHPWAGMTCTPLNSPNTISTIMPQSPSFDDSYKFTSFKNGLYLAHGSILGSYYLPAILSIYKDNTWAGLNNNNGDVYRYHDISDVAIDPADDDHVFAAGWEEGIFEIKDRNIIKVYDDTNTGNAINRLDLGDYHPTRTGTAAVDKDKNYWFTNSMQNHSLVVFRNDGTWANFETNTGSEDITTLMIDSVYNYKWFIGTANRIYVHDGVNRFAYVNPNNGSKLSTSKVNCLAQDHDNEIWIGTEKGIKVIYSTYNVFANGGNGEESPTTCSNILYSEGENIEYLLAYEEITCIAVDGANRKWIGTANGGVFLISENGTEQLLHFSSTNSPLPSDKINTIGILPNTGEVFIGTANGIVSYRGTATYAESKPADTIYAFPNPVPADFNGTIGIKGFTRDALVHITDAAGHVVYSTQAHGGQAVWNGRTVNGKRVASGVYYVFASDKNGDNRSVAKIMILN